MIDISPIPNRSALPQSEAFNRTLVDSSRDCLKILSLEGRLLWMNDEGQRMLCIQDFNAVLGKSWIDFWAGEDREAARNAIASARNGGAGKFTAMYRINGDERWFDVLVSPIRGLNGRPEQLLAASRDITERKRSEEALNETQRQLAADFRRESVLHELAVRYVTHHDFGSMLNEIVEAAITLTRAQRGTLQLLDAATGSLQLHASKGFSKEWLDFYKTVYHEGAACGEAKRTGRRFIVHDVRSSPVFVGTPALAVQLKEGVHAVQSTPLLTRSGQLLGMISTHFSQPHTPGDREIYSMDLLARQAADLIERHHAEQIIRDNQEQLALVSNSIPALISYVDSETRYRFCNHTYAEWFGLPIERVLGRTMREVLGEQAWEALAPHVKSALAGNTVTYESEIPYSHGPRRWIHATYTPHKDPAGLVKGIVVMVLDISDRKHAESRLLEQARLLELSADAIVVRRLDGTILYWNKGAELTYGWNRDQAIGGNLHSLLQTVFPQPLAKIESQLDKAGAWSGEVIQTRHDGSKITVLCRKVLDRDDAGLARAVLETNTDITERKRSEKALRESEERFRTLGENIAQLAWMADPDGYIFWYNKRWYEYTGTTFEEMQGWGWEKVHDPIELKRMLPNWRQSLASGKPWEDVFPLRRHDGKYGWFLSRAFPIRDASGKIVRWFGTNTDITELRETQLALQNAQRELQQHAENLEHTVAERTASLRETIGELEAFSYTVAHDMRAPLRAMQSFSSILINDYGEDMPPEAIPFLTRIATSATRLDALIQDVLNYSKIVRAELTFEPIDTRALLAEIIDTYPNLQPGAADITLPDRMPNVIGSRAALTQVFSNILGNAVKFVARGTRPRVTIRSEPAPLPLDDSRSSHSPQLGSALSRQSNNPSTHKPDAGFVRLWFEDNGIGIDPRELPRLFLMFHRANGPGEYEGTGIGLAIVRKAVERMGGRVGVESKVERGTRFWIELPRA